MAVTTNSSAEVRPGVTIRQAVLADAVEIATLGAHTFTATFAHSVQLDDLQAFLDESYTVSAIIKDLNDQDRDVIVAADADTGKILGFAYLTRGSTEPCLEGVPDTVELQRIYVHPEAHGRGVGSALSDRIHVMAREQGSKNIWLGVWEENFKAIRTYEFWGYRKVGHHDFTIGPVIQTDHIMVKAL